jgi:hypothetical protein
MGTKNGTRLQPRVMFGEEQQGTQRKKIFDIVLLD